MYSTLTYFLLSFFAHGHDYKKCLSLLLALKSFERSLTCKKFTVFYVYCPSLSLSLLKSACGSGVCKLSVCYVEFVYFNRKPVTDEPTYIHTYKHTSCIQIIHTIYVHTYIRAYVHASNVHTCTYIKHTYIHTYTSNFLVPMQLYPHAITYVLTLICLAYFSEILLSK